jgi:hypothetical protein
MEMIPYILWAMGEEDAEVPSIIYNDWSYTSIDENGDPPWRYAVFNPQVHSRQFMEVPQHWEFL